jgi:hypothetical protein
VLRPQIALSSLLLALFVTPRDARALELVRLSRNGYVLVDEEGAERPYQGMVPTRNSADTLDFVAEVTRIIAETPGAPRARFVAVMQSGRDFGNALAFYLPIKNTVRGIGQRQLGRETWDLNDTAGTAFPLLGFVWLNSWRLYLDAAGQFGNFQVCTQEFGHRWGPQTLIPPAPTGESLAMDASVFDGTDASGTADDDASTGDARAFDAHEFDGHPPSDDASRGDASPGAAPALAPTALLGRDRVHWSFFVHSGGSPLEGNNWSEIAPGVFRAERPTFRFSPLDLYLMGVLAPEEVPPSFVIAEPEVGEQLDQNNQRITASSTPETSDRGLTIRGRRVDFGIVDVLRANGPRVPPAVTVAPTRGRDGGLLPDASSPAEPRENDIDVIWVMLTTRDRLRDIDVLDFDRAVEACTDAYAYASEGRSLLLAQRAPALARDAGTTDAASSPRDAASDGAVTDAGTVDPAPLGGGCACRASPRPHGPAAPWWIAALASAAALHASALRAPKRRARAR